VSLRACVSECRCSGPRQLQITSYFEPWLTATVGKKAKSLDMQHGRREPNNLCSRQHYQADCGGACEPRTWRQQRFSYGNLGNAPTGTSYAVEIHDNGSTSIHRGWRGSLSKCHTVLTPVDLLWAVLKSTRFLPWQHVILAPEATRLHSLRPTPDHERWRLSQILRRSTWPALGSAPQVSGFWCFVSQRRLGLSKKRNSKSCQAKVICLVLLHHAIEHLGLHILFLILPFFVRSLPAVPPLFRNPSLLSLFTAG
jgi:hypothetical protein